MKKENWILELDSEELDFCAKKTLTTMNMHEISYCDVKAEFLEKNEKDYCLKFGIDPTVDMQIHLELHNFMRVEDYFHDDSTLRKRYKRGEKDANPYMESTVECIQD